MISFERVIYEDIKDECCCPELEFLLEVNKTQIERYACDNNVNLSDLKKQIKLHAPRYEKSLYTTKNFLKKNIFPTLDSIFKEHKTQFNDYYCKCGAEYIERNSRLCWQHQDGVKKLVICHMDSDIEAEIREVDNLTGFYLESHLHYLKAPRKDSVLRLGLYIKNFPLPICYMNFCPLDREDKLLALKKSLDEDIKKAKVIELSRVFGCGNLPLNTVSLLVGYASKFFRKKNYLYMITAVNLTLGFNGNSMLASQFVPYATRPVKYYYDEQNRYCTSRKGTVVTKSPNNMPPNILYVRRVASCKARDLKYCKLVDIYNDFSYNETAIEHEIYDIRQQLEGIWNEKTRYHGTIPTKNDYISKGQCGVSSLLLARILIKRGYDVLFCEGNVKFPIESNSIYNHCWIKVINYNKRNENVIIDITPDQNGYKQKIIFKTEQDLKKLKIIYEICTEKEPESVDVEHLIKRLAYLEQEWNEGGAKDE